MIKYTSICLLNLFGAVVADDLAEVTGLLFGPVVSTKNEVGIDSHLNLWLFSAGYMHTMHQGRFSLSVNPLAQVIQLNYVQGGYLGVRSNVNLLGLFGSNECVKHKVIFSRYLYSTELPKRWLCPIVSVGYEHNFWDTDRSYAFVGVGVLVF